LKWAQTLDGQLADDSDQSQWISGPEERRYTHFVRSRHDAVLVGARTFLNDRCRLTVRDVPHDGVQPVRVILDPRGRVLAACRRDESLRKSLQSGERRTYILTDLLEEIGEENALPSDVVHIPYRLDEIQTWLGDILYFFGKKFSAIEKHPLQKIMVEGGPATLALFLRSGNVDNVEIAISPLILGGRKHRVKTGALLSNVARFSLLSQERFGADVILRYETKRTNEKQLKKDENTR
jgi:diaminohydroxyphosphoribosylaminopyrimidine deaminase/5-amino-6-(5-phosphoribosylamino)uracil reductase